VTSRPATDVVVAPDLATDVVACTVVPDADGDAVGTVVVPDRTVTVALDVVVMGSRRVLPIVGTVEPLPDLDGALLQAARPSATPPQRTIEIPRCNTLRTLQPPGPRVCLPGVGKVRPERRSE
jgi:hypothetical protein